MKKIFTAPEIKVNPIENTPPFSPLIFVGNEIDGVTTRSFGGSTAISGNAIRNKQREVMTAPTNTFEKGDSAISVTIMADGELLKKLEGSSFKELLEKGKADAISAAGEGGDHFTLNKLDLSQLKPDEIKMLVDHMVISVGDRDGQGPLEIAYLGSKVSRPLQDYIKSEIALLRGQKESNSSKVMADNLGSELLNVWKYLKSEGRTAESEEGTVRLDQPPAIA